MTEENLGRLHIVKKPKKSFNCRVCSKEIPCGSYSFRQHVYNTSFFPVDSRVCKECGEKMNTTDGIEIVGDKKE